VKRTLRNYPYSSKYLLLRSAEKKKFIQVWNNKPSRDYFDQFDAKLPQHFADIACCKYAGCVVVSLQIWLNLEVIRLRPWPCAWDKTTQSSTDKKNVCQVQGTTGKSSCNNLIAVSLQGNLWKYHIISSDLVAAA